MKKIIFILLSCVLTFSIYGFFNNQIVIPKPNIDNTFIKPMDSKYNDYAKNEQDVTYSYVHCVKCSIGVYSTHEDNSVSCSYCGSKQ